MIRASSLDVPYQTAFTNGTLEAVADVPVEKGGAGRGFGPHELLEAAFATCLTMTAQMYAAEPTRHRQFECGFGGVLGCVLVGAVEFAPHPPARATTSRRSNRVRMTRTPQNEQFTPGCRGTARLEKSEGRSGERHTRSWKQV